jgi:hypothetical protein
LRDFHPGEAADEGDRCIVGAEQGEVGRHQGEAVARTPVDRIEFRVRSRQVLLDRFTLVMSVYAPRRASAGPRRRARHLAPIEPAPFAARRAQAPLALIRGRLAIEVRRQAS